MAIFFVNWKLKDLGVFWGSNFRVQHHPRLSKFCLGLEWRKLEPIHLWSKLIHFLDYKPSGIESINKSRFGGRNMLKPLRLVDRPQLGAENGDQRNIATLLADQVECANVIVINKVGMGQRNSHVVFTERQMSWMFISWFGIFGI